MLAQLFGDMLQMDEEGEHKVGLKEFQSLLVLRSFWWFFDFSSFLFWALLLGLSKSRVLFGKSLRSIGDQTVQIISSNQGHWHQKCRDLLQDVGGAARRADDWCDHLCQCLCSDEGGRNKYWLTDGDVYHTPHEQGTLDFFTRFSFFFCIRCSLVHFSFSCLC